MRHRILIKLESEQDLTLQKLAEDCQRCISVKKDSKNIEQAGIAHVRKVRRQTNFPSSQTNRSDFPASRTGKIKFSNYNQHKKIPPSPCYRCGSWHWVKDCTYRFKTCLSYKQIGHKSSHFWYRKESKSRIRITRTDQADETNIRKYVQVEMQNRKVKLQLDSGSDLTIINLQTWRKLNKPVMLKTDKIARSVTERKIKFEGEVITNVTFNGMTKKLKIYVLRNTENLFGTDWMQKFELLDLPIST